MKEQNITVALRVRPINRREVRSGARPIARVVDKNLVVLMDPNRDSDDILRAKRSHDHSYMFDVAFSQRATQRDVYQRTSQGLVSKVISGYNATVFAYGPTGAGKTYTMLGKTGEPGIMTLTLSDLFAKMEQNKATSRYRVTMAYLEIYNEMVRNLLGPSVGILDLREDAHGATVVSGLTEVEVHDSDEVMGLLTQGNLRRTCEPTAVNKTSSRSHAVLKVKVEQQSRVLNMCQKIRTGVLFMIDLAGSERAANTRNRGLRMKEGAHINRSLLALANCINTLSSGGQYVNYRDSKLTRLLKDALSGNSFTVMIAHISPASSCYEESKNTLKYADRVKHLKTKVSSNVVEVDQHVSEYQACLESMRTRILELERQLEWREGEGDSLCTDLRALLKEEKIIREEMVSLEHRLLLNAVERQKHTATIRLLGVASTPSPLPPSSLSPLPTTLEDTGQASLLFQRSSNWFAEPSHMIEPSLSIEDITAPRGSHMTTVETKQSDYITTSEPAEESTDHTTTVESSHDGPAVRGGEEEEEEEVSQARTELVRLQMDRRRLEARHRRLGRKLMETRTKKSQLQTRVSVSGRLHPHQVELCAALQLCGELEEEGRQRELAGAQASLHLHRREATLEGLLVLNHQLIAALHQYKTLLEGDRLPPLEPLLSRSSHLTWHAERERRLPVAGRALQLPTFSAFSARVCSTAMAADRLPPLEPLLSRSSHLTWHAERERRLPVAGRALQLPTFSAFSARVCSTAGSKSNLLVEDVTDGEEEEVGGASITDTSDVPLSSLPQDSLGTLPLFSCPSLLPTIPVSTSLTSPSTTRTPHNVIFPNPSLPAAFPLSNIPLNQCRFCSHTPTPPTLPLHLAPPQSGAESAVPSSKRTSVQLHSDTDSVVQPTSIQLQSGTETVVLSTNRTSSELTSAAETAAQSTKRTSILSKVGLNAARISVSRSSVNKSKYVVNDNSPIVTEDCHTEGSVKTDTMAADSSNESPVLKFPSSTQQLQEPHASSSSNEEPLVPTTAESKSLKLPATSLVPRGDPPESETEERKELQQSGSQLSLTHNTHGKTRSGVAGRRGRRILRANKPPTIPVVKTTEQRAKRESLPVKTVNRAQQSTMLPKRRQQRERQTLVPSKVIAGGSHVNASPYLKTTAAGKFEAKKIVFKRTNPPHQVPKFKSPYHISMAKTNKTKK